MSSINIPESVESIGEYAFFSCSSLTSINIPDSVKEIKDYAFYECENLKSITIGKNLETIGKGAFASCKELTSISTPNSLKKIGINAFNQCEKFKSVSIPRVKEICNYAFSGCVNLEEFSYPLDTELGELILKDCPKLKNIEILQVNYPPFIEDVAALSKV